MFVVCLLYGIGVFLSPLLVGCQSIPSRGADPQSIPRVLDPVRDTLVWTNETEWLYFEDPDTGGWLHQKKFPEPEYTHRCFGMVRFVKSVFLHARFDPESPALSEHELLTRMTAVTRRSARRVSEPQERVQIPGWIDLAQLSHEHPDLLKQVIGGKWRSYVQWNHRKMIRLQFRWRQDKEFEDLLRELENGYPVSVHVFRFPSLTINHSVLILSARPDTGEVPRAQGIPRPTPDTRPGGGNRVFWILEAYDPNAPGSPIQLAYSEIDRRFFMQNTPYFPGGPIQLTRFQTTH